MKIEVKNFGPIKKGTVDLDKKVTVFVGYNNSGKTYMSQLLWGLNSFYSLSEYNGGNFIPSLIFDKNGITSLSSEIIKNWTDGFDVFIKSHVLPSVFNVKSDYFSNEQFLFKLKEEFTDHIFAHAFTYVAAIRNDDIKNKPSTFSSLLLFEKKANSFQVSFERSDFDRLLQYPEIRTENVILNLNPEASYLLIYKNTVPFDSIAKEAISSIIFRILFDSVHSPFLLPANRVFYPSFIRYIFSSAKEERDAAENIIKNGGIVQEGLLKKPYSEPIDVLIDRLYNLNTTTEAKPFYLDLIDELNGLIGGNIEMKSTGFGPVEFNLKLATEKELDMYMSSSAANQLTTLYLYLKYWAEEKDNYLIIDEPEENLHPDNQIKLVNILMKFADRNNNKILITTHSPLITDHINNYANLSYLKEQDVDVSSMVNDKFTHMANIESIAHKDYGVYFFNGSGIQEYEVGNYGAYFEDFQKAENNVKETSNALKNSIYDKLHPNA